MSKKKSPLFFWLGTLSVLVVAGMGFFKPISIAGHEIGFAALMNQYDSLEVAYDTNTSLLKQKDDVINQTKSKEQEVEMRKQEITGFVMEYDQMVAQITQNKNWQFHAPSLLIQLEERATKSGIGLTINYEQITDSYVALESENGAAVPEENNEDATAENKEEEVKEETKEETPTSQDSQGVKDREFVIKETIVPISLTGDYNQVIKFIELLEVMQLMGLEDLKLDKNGDTLSGSFNLHVRSLAGQSEMEQAQQETKEGTEDKANATQPSETEKKKAETPTPAEQTATDPNNTPAQPAS